MTIKMIYIVASFLSEMKNGEIWPRRTDHIIIYHIHNIANS